jgi:hypothetical protein
MQIIKIDATYSLALWERAGVRVKIQPVIHLPNSLPEGEGTYSAFL